MAAELPRLRADARDNREQIVTAARALFAERGLEVGMREVARRAGVGPATLYRRFATRQALVDEAFALELDTCRQIVVEACADPDPWAGLASAVRRLVVLNVRNRGFVEAFTADNPPGAVIVEHRRELLAELTGLARRAQQAGRLRHDFVISDLLLVLEAGRGLAHAGAREAAARRFAELTLDAFRPRDSTASIPTGVVTSLE